MHAPNFVPHATYANLYLTWRRKASHATTFELTSSCESLCSVCTHFTSHMHAIEILCFDDDENIENGNNNNNTIAGTRLIRYINVHC